MGLCPCLAPARNRKTLKTCSPWLNSLVLLRPLIRLSRWRLKVSVKATMNEETLFHLAREKSGSERTAFLDETCKDNPQLRQRVQELLEAHENPDGFMQSPPIAPPANVEGPGSQAGRYK